jgi:hypothetical protein
MNSEAAKNKYRESRNALAQRAAPEAALQAAWSGSGAFTDASSPERQGPSLSPPSSCGPHAAGGAARAPPMSPMTPMSDFRNFAETLLSPLSPSHDAALQQRVPTSRDWVSYTAHIDGPDHFAADFVSTMKRVGDAQFGHAQQAAASPHPHPGACLQGAGSGGVQGLDELVFSEAASSLAIDNNCQVQLMANAQALASRLTKGRVGTSEQYQLPEYKWVGPPDFNSGDASATAVSGAVAAPVKQEKGGPRKRRKVAKVPEPLPLPAAGAQHAAGDMADSYQSGGVGLASGTDLRGGDCLGIAFGLPGDSQAASFEVLAPANTTYYPLPGQQQQQQHSALTHLHSVGGASPPLQRHDMSVGQDMLYQHSMGNLSHAYSDGGNLKLYADTAASHAARGRESPMAARRDDGSSISPAVNQLGQRPMSCNCKKSRCLKLYCDCFRAQKYCDGCNCQQCANSPENEFYRQRSMASIMERNPEAFKLRITSDSPQKQAAADGGEGSQSDLSPAVVQYHLSGCHCKKSACLKKYCECYQAHVPCQARCRCQDCRNTVADCIFVDGSRASSDSPVCGGERYPAHTPTGGTPHSAPRGPRGPARAATPDYELTPADADACPAVPDYASAATKQPLVQRPESLISRAGRSAAEGSGRSLPAEGAAGGARYACALSLIKSADA